MSYGRALFRIGVWSAIVWLLLCLPTLHSWPLESRDAPLRLKRPIYVDPAFAPLFVSGVQETAYKLNSACPMPARNRLVLLGGSGSLSLEPEPLQQALAVEEVLNLSVILSNISQLHRVFEDLRACLGPEGIAQAHVVLVLSLGNFAKNGIRGEGPYTHYETEKLRTKLFKGKPGELRPRVARQWLPLLLQLSRPLLLARKINFESERAPRLLGEWGRVELLGGKPRPAMFGV